MRVHSPTSRSGSRIYLSIWDLFWALVSPILALYLRDIDIQSNADWSVIASYWVLSAGFAILAFFAFRLQDGMTRYFSVHEALDIAEAVLFAELMTFAVLFTLTRLDGEAFGSPGYQRMGPSQWRQAGNQTGKRKVGRVVCPKCIAMARLANPYDDHQRRNEGSCILSGNFG